MPHLRTFGRLDLHLSSGGSADLFLAQPRTTALLVYLLLVRPRGFVRRDTLCALFWPDSDDAHARGALSQALSRIRRYAGQDVFELRGKSEIRVRPGAVECDVLDFEEAVAERNSEKALDLYAGSFLSGFHVHNARGFEEWASTERERLRRLAVEAARGLAHQHIAENRLPEASRAGARALTLAPESEAVAEELVSALARAGARGEALHLFDSWASTMARELDLEPSDDLQALAEGLRAGARGDGDRRDPAHSESVEAVEEPVVEGPVPALGASGTPFESPRRQPFLLVAAAVVLLAMGWLVFRVSLLSAEFPVEASGRAIGGLAQQDWLLVADVQAPSVDPGLALAFQTLLIRDVESAGYTSVVGGVGAMSRRGLGDVLARMRLPPDTPIDVDMACRIAEREGAAGVLSSQVLPLGSDYVLTASVVGVPGCQELIRASAVASFDELSAAVRGLSRELRARLGESRASIRSSPSLPPMTAAYVEALREVSRYLSTRELWEDSELGASALEEALRIDPRFAFAHFLLAIHHQRLGRFEMAMPHLQQAYALRADLPRQGRLGMEALYQRYVESNPRAAMATVETLIADYPAISDATLPFLADVALWLGDRERALDVSLEHLRSGPTGLGAHLTQERAWTAAWGTGRVDLADSLFAAIQANHRVMGGETDPSTELLHHLRHRDWAGAEEYCSHHSDWDRCGYLYLARGRLSKATQVLSQTLAPGAGGTQVLNRVSAASALAYLQFLGGRPDDAVTLLQRSSASLATPGFARALMHLSRFLLCGTAAEMGRSAELAACAIEQEDPAEWDADPSFTVLLRSGAWSRRLLALRSLEGGDAEAALEQAREAVRSNFGTSALVDHLILARAHDALSRPDSALSHYVEGARIERDGMFPTAAGILFPLAPVYRRIAELAEASGDTVMAIQYYKAFTELWSQADPEFQPLVEAVRRRVRDMQG